MTMQNTLSVQERQRKARTKKIISSTVLYAIMTVLAIILIFPYLFMVSKSLMTSEEVVNPQIVLIPSVPQFINYINLFTESGYLKATMHTCVIILFNLIAVPISASLVAYSFAKLRWWGRSFMFAFMLSTMMLPAVVTQLPLYVIYSRIGWIDTLYPFTIPNMFGGGAIYIFLLRQFMMGIPKDMSNAARIDGASQFRIYWNIILPLCKPVLIYVMINVFISYWGDYYGPLIYMHSSDAPRTLAYVLFLDSTEKDASLFKANMRMTGGVFMSLIPVILFAIFQNQLIDGIIMTGVKD